MAASANLAPGGATPGPFEPCTARRPTSPAGESPTRGEGWSAAVMLEHSGDAASRVLSAVEETYREGTRTRDVGGTASTVEVGDAVAARVARAS